MKEYDKIRIDEDVAFQKIIAAIQRNSKRKMSDDELREAARNLISFYKLIVEIHRQNQKDKSHAKYH